MSNSGASHRGIRGVDGESQPGWGHGEAGVHPGDDVLALRFEVEGCGRVVGGAVGEGAGPGDGCRGGVGVEVGEFEEGGEVCSEGFGVLAGALDGFVYGLLPGLAVGG